MAISLHLSRSRRRSSRVRFCFAIRQAERMQNHARLSFICNGIDTKRDRLVFPARRQICSYPRPGQPLGLELQWQPSFFGDAEDCISVPPSSIHMHTFGYPFLPRSVGIIVMANRWQEDTGTTWSQRQGRGVAWREQGSSRDQQQNSCPHSYSLNPNND